MPAIPDVCAWPNLTLLQDGTIVAIIWNQPCHGSWEGDLDCWASTDGGQSWTKRSQVSQHDSGTNRMNHAAGLAKNGDLLTLVSGWSNRDVVGKPSGHHGVGHTLQTWVYRSGDGGRTWRRIGEFPNSGQQSQYIPFGDICMTDDGILCASAYFGDEATNQMNAFLLRSNDDGCTWGDMGVLNPAGNETAVLHLGQGHWVAASREEAAENLELLISDDNGYHWSKAGALTKPEQVTGHLLRLNDGKVLLSYGNRIEGECGVEARLSEDNGKSWGDPIRLADMPFLDGGYPSSIQRADGMIVTAYYATYPEKGPNQYEMDVVIWEQ